MDILIQMSIKQIHGTPKLLLGNSYIQNKIATSSILAKRMGCLSPLHLFLILWGILECPFVVLTWWKMELHHDTLALYLDPHKMYSIGLVTMIEILHPTTTISHLDPLQKLLRNGGNLHQFLLPETHLGHYKSLLDIDSKSNTYTEDNPDPGPNVLQLIYHTFVAAFCSGLTLPRWQNITTCVIEKARLVLSNYMWLTYTRQTTMPSTSWYGNVGLYWMQMSRVVWIRLKQDQDQLTHVFKPLRQREWNTCTAILPEHPRLPWTMMPSHAMIE